MTTKFKPGERVRWTESRFRPDLVGMTGTVREMQRFDNVNVAWDVARERSMCFPESITKLTARKAYIAGPMTGIENRNYPAFFAAAKKLASWGYEVENPADNDGPTCEEAVRIADERGWSLGQYLRIDLPRLLTCDLLVLLPGHESSQGAQIELTVANACGIASIELADLEKLVPCAL